MERGGRHFVCRKTHAWTPRLPSVEGHARPQHVTTRKHMSCVMGRHLHGHYRTADARLVQRLPPNLARGSFARTGKSDQGGKKHHRSRRADQG